MLCNDCARIESELLTPAPPEDRKVLEQRLLGILPDGMSDEDCNKAQLGMRLKASYDALQLSAKNGCEFCSLFADQIHPKEVPYSSPALKSQERARAEVASTRVPITLHRLRTPQKLREYLASGDYLALRTLKGHWPNSTLLREMRLLFQH